MHYEINCINNLCGVLCFSNYIGFLVVFTKKKLILSDDTTT